MVKGYFTRASNTHHILKIQKCDFFFFSWYLVYGTQGLHVVGKLSSAATPVFSYSIY